MNTKNFLQWLFPVFTALLMGGCEANTVRTAHDHATETTTNNRLTLNNGEKWETDKHTRLHATNLLLKSHTFHQKTYDDVSAYHTHAADLQTELNSLIKDCKMTGAPHDALHLWLEPVLEDVREMSGVNDAASGKILAKELHEKLVLFDLHFK